MSDSGGSDTLSTRGVLRLRIAAEILDLIVQFGLITALLVLGVFVLDTTVQYVQGGTIENLAVSVVLVTTLVYNIVLEWRWGGQTIGKRLKGVRVRSQDDHGAPSLRQVVVRNLPAPLAFNLVVLVVGLVAIVVSDRNQRLFDRAASTVVTRS